MRSHLTSNPCSSRFKLLERTLPAEREDRTESARFLLMGLTLTLGALLKLEVKCWDTGVGNSGVETVICEKYIGKLS